ncbi:ABC transporter permease [Conyzicola nivalis]|uniref:ABC transporter permease n=1 Tax=Conyzicola nivalis TaxID=1477021 RepID=A0A916SMP0_9MICO|nr:ABC transporter permease [Conyzicola nivalis]GGB07768.1 ABC transporter permease [Conyzicola nivalis]
MTRNRGRESNPGSSAPPPSRLRAGDLAYVGSTGLRARPMRAVLSALGVAIGIAAMVAVVGISTSSRERLDSQLAELGTNLLTVTVAEPTGAVAPLPLPSDASARVERIAGVTGATATADLSDVHVYRNPLVDEGRTGGLTVTASELDLLSVVGAELRSGQWFNPATAALPTTVLGATAAERLGVREVGGLVWLDGRNTTVLGILEPVPLAAELDIAALVGMPVAAAEYDYAGNPTRVYERSEDDAVIAVRELLPPSVQPPEPADVVVSRPSDALTARAAVDEVFTGMLLALGSISLLVGGIGVANTMIISVLERRREIGLRRAIGATRRHIRLQFLTEAVLLSAMGGVAGAGLGAAVTAAIAAGSGWVPVIPAWIVVGGVLATIGIGAVAGLYPAVRAARTPPSVALSS